MIVTMADVAKRAKVGIGTVSRVINNSARVRDGTRQRVLAAANELGYRQTRIARALVHQGSYAPTIGVVSPCFTMRSLQLEMLGVHKAAAGGGYHLLLTCPPPGADVAMVLERAVRQFHVDGMLLLPDRAMEQAPIRQLVGPMMPVVSCGEMIPDIPSVYPDNHHGGRLAAEHLWDRGCRRPAVVALPKFPARRIAFIEFFREHGVTGIEQRTADIVEYNEKEGYDLTERLLGQGADGFFYCSDLLAVGGLAKLRSAGRTLPVIGYDNLDFAGPMGLTTVDQKLEETGRVSLEMLSRQIESRGRVDPSLMTNRVLLPQLAVRGT